MTCSDSVGVSFHGSRYCFVRFALLICSAGSGKIPVRHPSVRSVFRSYPQLTDRCSVFPLTQTSLHRLMESYHLPIATEFDLQQSIMIGLHLKGKSLY